MNTITASPAKLRDGSWGARVPGSATVGQTIHIRTKAGKEWDASVTTVIWSGNGVTLVATRGLDRKPASARTSNPRSRRANNGRCRECGGPLRDVPHHRAMGGLCGQCAFDEYDC